ncbi:condensation domain-containing protein, partial [Oribacterium sp. NK2B42]|uniref:condensation domain-containing protein n=1 Tax=Oribacterium sp. NK2B42 TaxID=689781 RepID=UPI0005D16804
PVIEVTIEEIVPAENEMQEKILDIAKEVIGTDKIGITTDLFAAGLSSLSSIRMSSLLKDRVDANISIAELFDNRTVRSIEALISGKAPEEEFEIRSEYPLSMTQMGIFVESVKYSGTTVYNIPYLYKLDECVDMDKLDEALSKAVEAHPYLSMTMKQSDDGNIIAIRNKKDRVAISVSDTKPVLDDLVEPFDLTDGTPLYRIELFDTADGKYLFVDFHHIIMDGESFEIFLQDVNKAYLGQTLKAEQFTGFEYALSEEKKRNSNAYEAAKDFYDSVFKGCEPCTLPVKENKTSGGHIASDSRTGATSAESIREYCSKQNISENAFFTVAFGLALKAYTSSEEAIFTTIYNGRNDPRLSDSVGMFVKTFPVMLRSNEGDKITDVLSACSQYLIGAMSHDIFSFNEISNRYGIRSDVIFAYQGDSNGDKELVIGGFAVSETEEQDLSQAKASIDMNVMLDGDKIEYEYEYDPEMYSSYTLDGLVGMMDRIVSELIVRDKIGDISLVIEEDKQKIISLHDSFYAVKERPAYRLLQDSAEENPDKVALVAVDRTLTYKELNEEANAVGHALIAEARKIHADSFGAFGHESAVMMDDSLARYTGGVSGDRIATGGVVGGLSTEPCDGSEGSHGLAPDTIVAVMADRDSYAYVMRDGVLKAGGAFLPIDPEYPE